MTETIKLSASKRTGVGTGAARALRREGKVPAVIYGGGGKSENIALPLKEFNIQYQKGSFQTKLIELDFGSEKVTALPKVVSLHPVTDIPEHVDFIRVGKDTAVRVFVNVRIINEDKSIGIKRGGVVNVVHRAIEFLCHPSKIPNNIEVDVSALDIGQNIHIADLTLPDGVKPADSSNFTVVSLAGRASDEEKTATSDAETTTAASAAGAPAAAGAKAATGAAAGATKAAAPQKKK